MRNTYSTGVLYEREKKKEKERGSERVRKRERITGERDSLSLESLMLTD